MSPKIPLDSNEIGRRAEEVASWYFRLNGVLHIPSFVLHSERVGEQITDADILGVRFPYSVETLGGDEMTDDDWLDQRANPEKTLVIIAEVKAKLCRVNGQWTDPRNGGMERVIRRIGFLPEAMTEQIATSLYRQLFWENDQFVVRYIAIGIRMNHKLTNDKPHLKQLRWSDLAAFLLTRFQGFGRLKGIPSQWPKFGRLFAKAVNNGTVSTVEAANKFIMHYIEKGKALAKDAED